jgi:speckle-type POZ protein
MFDSCFMPFKLHYLETNSLAVGDVVYAEPEVISVGGYLWRAYCYPRGDIIENNKAGDYLSIYIELMSNATGVKTIFVAFVLDKYGEPSLFAEGSLHVYSSKGPCGWGWPQFAKRSDLESQCVRNGWITIVCGVIVVRNDPLSVPSSDIGDHLGRLLDRADGSDVSFVVDGKEFAAHRAVLAARSPVFKAELLGSMAESTMSRITLDDIEPATFKAFLRFIYTDTLPEDDDLGDSPTEMYQRLLAVADRYAMDRLKLICASKLWDNVTVNTVAATLCHAETYNCPELKGKCIAFFAEEKNFREAVLSDGFVELVQRFPSILVELREKDKN